MIAAGIADYKQCEELPDFAIVRPVESLTLGKELDFDVELKTPSSSSQKHGGTYEM
jgi:hypothetical protein